MVNESGRANSPVDSSRYFLLFGSLYFSTISSTIAVLILMSLPPEVTGGYSPGINAVALTALLDVF